MLRTFKDLTARWGNYLIFLASSLWLSLFLIPSEYFDPPYYTISNTIMVVIIPLIGLCLIVLSICHRRLSWFLSGLIFLFAFWITLGLGHFIFGG